VRRDYRVYDGARKAPDANLSGLEFIIIKAVLMVRGITVVMVLFAFASGCSSIKTENDKIVAEADTSIKSNLTSHNLSSQGNVKSDSDEGASSSLNSNPTAKDGEANAAPARNGEYETLLWQQAETLQRQRESILELQQQREVMQKQIQELAESVNRHAQANTAPVQTPSVVPLKVEDPNKSTKVDASGKLILGHVEWAWFDLFGESVKARIDTGAKTSTIFASDIQVFERDGSGWVSFTVSSVWLGNQEESGRKFESPLVRKVKVKNSDADAASRSKPVVRLTTKVGSIVEDIEFVLQAKNSGTDGFPIILGRSFIRDIAIVDAAQELTQKKHTKASSL
jgi:hypothetical protein